MLKLFINGDTYTHDVVGYIQEKHTFWIYNPFCVYSMAGDAASKHIRRLVEVYNLEDDGIFAQQETYF